MSRIIEVTALRDGNLFALPNGSIYVAEKNGAASGQIPALVVRASSRSDQL